MTRNGYPCEELPPPRPRTSSFLILESLASKEEDCASPGTGAGDIERMKHSVIYFRRYTLMKRRSE
jgi:hypothetical protein